LPTFDKPHLVDLVRPRKPHAGARGPGPGGAAQPAALLLHPAPDLAAQHLDVRELVPALLVSKVDTDRRERAEGQHELADVLAVHRLVRVLGVVDADCKRNGGPSETDAGRWGWKAILQRRHRGGHIWGLQLVAMRAAGAPQRMKTAT